MKPIRVLVVDDSVVTRKLVTQCLAENPSIEVAGIAPNGKIALDKIALDPPDLVTLDVEMPVMDGLATLAEIRRTNPALPVVMFSTRCARGAAATLDALALGANDYVTKPSAKSAAETRRLLREELAPKIEALCGRSGGAAARSRAVATRRASSGGPVGAVVIGVSTGGPVALHELVPELPEDLGVPVLVVQHMPKLFTKYLAERLDEASPLTVREGADGAPVHPGEVWIAPGGLHMTAERRGGRVVVGVNEDPPVCSCRPSADVLFRSAARVWGRAVLAVVLTGMGQDGTDGCRTIVDEGGAVIVQDEETSVVWGMPGHVAGEGLAEEILPLGEVASAVVRRVRRSARAGVRGG